MQVLLVERKEVQGTLFESETMDWNREKFLTQTFSNSIEFEGRRRHFSFVPIGKVDQFLLGRIGRSKVEIHTLGPETKFAQEEVSSWHAANFILDSSGREGGQRLAIQETYDIGKPLSIAGYIADHLNRSMPHTRWLMNVNPVIESAEFWEVVEREMGHITTLDFEFIAPNIFGGKDATIKALRRLRDNNNMQSMSTQIKNADGQLNPNSEEIREGVEYVSKGGGELKLKSGKKTVYNSKDRGTRRDVDEEIDVPLTPENQSKWDHLIRRVMGR